MDYDQQPADEMPRIMPPVLWIGLSGFFALCCCFFFGVAGVEAILLTGGFTVGSPGTPSASTAKPAIGEVKFYLNQTSAGAASGPAVTSIPTTTTTIYAYFTYKNMPKSGLTWSYFWSLDGTDLPAASKTAQRWTKEGSGTFFVRLNDDKGLKTGDYDLSIQLNDQEVQTASIHLGP
jgi:hypothetical protein